MRFLFQPIFLAALFVCGAHAQVIPVTPTTPEIPDVVAFYSPELRPTRVLGETSVNLPLESPTFYPVRLTLPLGQRLRLTAPAIEAGWRIQWSKDSRVIASGTSPTSNVLVVDILSETDAGNYYYYFVGPGNALRASQLLTLAVGGPNRLLNSSARGKLAAGTGEALTAGFVVSAPAAKKILIRAIGPSLARFGIARPLAKPVLRIFDAKGGQYAGEYGYFLAVPSEATPAQIAEILANSPTAEKDLAQSLASVGAFPASVDAGDVVELRPFPPGAYTAQVTSADGTAGEVLIEIYEVPSR